MLQQGSSCSCLYACKTITPHAWVAVCSVSRGVCCCGSISPGWCTHAMVASLWPSPAPCTPLTRCLLLARGLAASPPQAPARHPQCTQQQQAAHKTVILHSGQSDMFSSEQHCSVASQALPAAPHKLAEASFNPSCRLPATAHAQAAAHRLPALPLCCCNSQPI